MRSCKKIGEDLFIVKHQSSYSCESAIYFNLTTDIIRKNCNFDFYYSKTDVTPTVLGGGNKIILANWPNNKHIICNINNDIPVKIPSHPYVLVNRSILCNCGIEVDSHHLLESLAACDNKPTELTMYFTINLAFSNYLELMPNMTHQLPISRGKTDFEQSLPIHLNILHFDNCKTSGSLHLFKITGTLTSEEIKLNKNYLWDTLEINWDKIKLSFNSNEIKLPKLVTIKIQDKIRVRRMMSRET